VYTVFLAGKSPDIRSYMVYIKVLANPIYVCLCAHRHMSEYMHVCVYVSVYMHMSVNVHACVNVCVCAFVFCLCRYFYACLDIHT